MTITTKFGTLDLIPAALAGGETMLRFVPHGENIPLLFCLPTFRVDGKTLAPALVETITAAPPTEVFSGVTEHRFRAAYAAAPHLSLEGVFRVAADSPVLRFRYILHSENDATGETATRLTKADGDDALIYSVFEIPARRATEVRFSEFSSLFHTFRLAEEKLTEGDFAAGRELFGPLLTWRQDAHSCLLAYEHGSQVPDAFLRFLLDDSGAVMLKAVKGNYWDGRIVAPDAPFETIWFQFAALAGDADALASAYREWILKYQTPNAGSRTPYLFYNTWNYQERVHNWYKKPYLAEMNETRMLAEIEVAHRMGIDVFVLDTGWYEKTGDWRVSSERFPNGLAPVKAKLDECGMKLGLWFNPIVAAVSSEMRKAHEDCLMTHNGKPHDPHEVWETEESQGICLVSRYGDAFADELIRLNRELGVTYYKWDAIGQYGCDAPGHGHGDAHNTPEERRSAYGFLLGRAMTNVVNKLCAACPDAIVDFDITEGGRTVGLQFLSAGKYFLINNGPYNHDYNMPVPADGNVNLFFFPGPARAWICRAPLDYDRWIPSVLFLTHYLPDADHKEAWGGQKEIHNQNPWIAVASLVLGQNGIWGDLCALPDDAIQIYADAFSQYKQVRDDITAASPLRTGDVGGSPEIHEKINPATNRGVVSFFAAAPGTYAYVTRRPAAPNVWHTDGVKTTPLPDGKIKIEATFAPGEYAKVIFFGV